VEHPRTIEGFVDDLFQGIGGRCGEDGVRWAAELAFSQG
jgi:hypothetical protein